MQRFTGSGDGVGAIDEFFRGATRSGARFTVRNQPHYSSLRQLVSHHRRLFDTRPVVTTNWAAVGSSSAGLLRQTTIRFAAGHADIAGDLRQIFLDLFRTSGVGDGFEVITTFNVVLSNHQSTSFSVFYGHDYRQDSKTGSHEGLTHGRPVLVSGLDDVSNLPTSFDFESLSRLHRQAFQDSDVRVVKFLNIVYLVYQYRRRQSLQDEEEATSGGGGRSFGKRPPKRKIKQGAPVFGENVAGPSGL